MNERRLFGRQRRANASVKRDRRYTVIVNVDEEARLAARAQEQGVTVPRLLFESAMSSRVETDTERKGLIAELFAIRRLLANVSGNMNQLARFANTESVFPAEAENAAAEYRELVMQLKRAVQRLADR
jgi:hypothetical protein